MIISSLLEEKEMIQVHIENEEEKSQIGNIYVGKVKNIVKNIDAAFVEIENKQMCYLPLKKEEMPVFANAKNNKKICIGDEILVQITTDGIKTKSPTITTNLSFSGKYLVLTHGITRCGVSNKLKVQEECNRLKDIAKNFPGKSCGYIVRTNAEGISEEILKQEAEQLYQLYERIKTTGVCKSCFSCIHRGVAGYLSDIRNGYESEIDEILTDDTELFEEIQGFLEIYQKEDIKKLQKFDDSQISLNHLYSIETQIIKALRERVWLKSGGYLVIQPTEALTVIDVNTGKAITGKKQREENFYKINMEAAKEIAKQLRLRNLSGIIVVDFIDMEEALKRKQLISFLSEQIRLDPVKTTFVDMTKLNLVELTRKKVRKPLHEQIIYSDGELHNNFAFD